MALSAKELDEKIQMVGDNAQIKLKRVRIRFGNPIEIRERESTDKAGKPTTRYTSEATFLLDEKEDIDQINLIKQAIKKVVAAKFPNVKNAVLPQNRCFQSGMIVDPDTDEKVERYAGCEGKMLLTARSYLRNADSENPVQIIGPRKTLVRGQKQWVQLTEENDGKKLIYAGCYVNVVCRIYALVGDSAANMPNRVSCSLEIVQHCGHGDEFSAPRADANDLMDEEETEEEDDGLDDDLGAASSSGEEDGDDDLDF